MATGRKIKHTWTPTLNAKFIQTRLDALPELAAMAYTPPIS